MRERNSRLQHADQQVEFSLTDFSRPSGAGRRAGIGARSMPDARTSCKYGWITVGGQRGPDVAVRMPYDRGERLRRLSRLRSPTGRSGHVGHRVGWISHAAAPVKVGEGVTSGPRVSTPRPRGTNARLTYTWASEADKEYVGIPTVPASNQALVTGRKCGTAKVKAAAGCGNATEIIVDVWSGITQLAVEPPTVEMGINTDLESQGHSF